MSALINFFLGISFFSTIFIVAFLIKRKPLAYYFFIGSYTIFLISLINNLFSANGVMIQFPHLFRVISPFQFLLGPLCYFFCRLTLRPYQKLTYWDLLHAAPFVLSVIGLMPIYLLSAEEKLALFNPSGQYTGLINRIDAYGLSFFTTLRIKFGISMIYMFFQWKMLVHFRKNAREELKKRNRLLIIWLNFDTSLKTFFGLFIFVTAWWTENISFVAIFQVCLVAFELITSTAFLISSPSLLQGLVFQSEIFTSPVTFKESDDREDFGKEELEQQQNLGLLPSEAQQEIIQSIETYFQAEQPFLRESFSLSQLSEAISVPSRQISQIIKQHFGLTFPEYINQIRFAHLESLMKNQPQVLEYSIDALAKMAGFSSRSGFYKAFKKNDKYQTPTQMIDYFKSVN